MAQATKIEWTDVSWNPVHGCSRVSTGCLHCYAETLSLRRGFTAVPWTKRNEAQNVMLKPHKLREPLSRAKPWDRPCRVFVNSMSDLFHEQIPDEYIAQVFAVMSMAEQHTFQVLTKRPERMRVVLSHPMFWLWVNAERMRYGVPVMPGGMSGFADQTEPFPLPNVWLGVSIENRKWVGRADVLRETPAAVRFISAEPLLGPLVLPPGPRPDDWRCRTCHGGGSVPVYELDGGGGGRACDSCEDASGTIPSLDLTGIDWCIVGGESGPSHRPFDPQWARDLRDACEASGTAYFMKQMGGARPGTALKDLPEDLRIREFPA